VDTESVEHQQDHAQLGLERLVASVLTLADRTSSGTLVLGVVTDLLGADAALGGTAIMMVAVAVLFGRLAPETYRAGRVG
jgi:hypothetical protein